LRENILHYCACNKGITKDRSRAGALSAKALLPEIDWSRKHTKAVPHGVSSCILGGGTANLSQS